MTNVDVKAKTILIIDDDETVGDLFEMLLRREGFKIEVVHSCKVALDRLKAESLGKFDLVVVDLMMPSPNGFQFIKELQNSPYDKIPLFVASALSIDSKALAEMRQQANVVEVWKKPVDIMKFKKKVREHLGLPQNL